MHNDWKGPFNRRLQRAASERGKRMAQARWKRDRERRAALALVTAEQYPSRIVRRIVVIDGELAVREAVIFAWDSRREAARKTRRVLAPAAVSRKTLVGEKRIESRINHEKGLAV
jgi:hypothetical protein